MTAPIRNGSREAFALNLSAGAQVLVGIGVRLPMWAFVSQYKFQDHDLIHAGPLRRVLHVPLGLYVGPSLRNLDEASAIIDHAESLPIDWSSGLVEVTAACQALPQDWDAVLAPLRARVSRRDRNAVEWILEQPLWKDAVVDGSVVRTVKRLVQVPMAFNRKKMKWSWEEWTTECVILRHPSGAYAEIPKDATAEIFA